jgi:hypothetical protein
MTMNTVISGFGTGANRYSLGLTSASFRCQGSADNLAHFVEHVLVQESTPSGWFFPENGFLCSLSPGPASLSFRFSDWSCASQDIQFFYPYFAVPLLLQDCQFHGGIVWDYDSCPTVTNCVFEQTWVDFEPTVDDPIQFRNNLIVGGYFLISPVGTNTFIKDNLFDRTPIEVYLSAGYDGGYNATVAGYDRLTPTNANDLIVSNTDYVVGPLGSFYYPSTGGKLSSLIDAGSLSDAGVAGLYHYTTIADAYSREGNSPLDIGFHYIDVGSDGKPLDSDGDGTPDYLEDINGNGLLESGETDWNNAADSGLTIQITHPKSNSILP